VTSEFDIFECSPDGDLLWRDSADSVERAKRKVLELAKKSKNDFQVLHIPSKTIVALATQYSSDK
jgi:hypothetical protein